MRGCGGTGYPHKGIVHSRVSKARPGAPHLVVSLLPKDPCHPLHSCVPPVTSFERRSPARRAVRTFSVACSNRLKSKGEGHLTRINDILTNQMEAERLAGLGK